MSLAISRRTPSKPDSSTADGRVVDDEVDAREGLERADVAPLAADDAPLQLVGGQLHHRHRGLHGVPARDSLHRGREDAARAAVGVAPGLLLHLADEPRAVVAQPRRRGCEAGSASPGSALSPATRSSSRTCSCLPCLRTSASRSRLRWRSSSDCSRRVSSASRTSIEFSFASRRSSVRAISARRSRSSSLHAAAGRRLGGGGAARAPRRAASPPRSAWRRLGGRGLREPRARCRRCAGALARTGRRSRPPLLRRLPQARFPWSGVLFRAGASAGDVMS